MTLRTAVRALALTAGCFLFVACEGPAGKDGSGCTLKQNDDGTATITCTDGTTVTVEDGEDGQDGADGKNGNPGLDGKDGEDGQDGEDGTDGKDGQPGKDGALTFLLTAEVPASLTVAITEVTPGNKPVVKLKATDAAGRGAVGLTAGNSGQLRFGIAKLVPGTNGNPDVWQSYINSKATAGSVSKTQATTERNGTLVDNKDGTYAYTFATDLSQAKDPVSNEAIAYDPALTHRVAIQVSGSVNGRALPVSNPFFDFVPSGATMTVKREVSSTAGCNECHGKMAFHGGGRTEMQFCVVCHNPGTTDPDTGNSVDMAWMTHKIHAAAMLNEQGAEPYKVIGYGGAVHDYSHVGYPQQLNNCRKCHNGAEAATPQGDNWKTKPSKDACGSCHVVDWAQHQGGQADNSACAMCHKADGIEKNHLTENATPNNPNVAAGLYNFTYELKEATVDADLQAVVTFRILKNGTAMDLKNAFPTDVTGGPSFLLAYAQAQDGVSEPADWNNLGRKAAQPASVSLASVKAGLSEPDSGGYHTVTLTGFKFPAGAKLRAVALQGYWTQKDVGGKVGNNIARHTVAAYKGVTGDAPRRAVVDDEKCGSCHEWFEGHGGNRVKTTLVCAMCHVPNLTSSGRGADLANMTQAEKDKALADGVDLASSLNFPEASNNLKDMVHGIHAAHMRENAFRFARDRGTSGVYYYNFGHVTYPNALNNCQACHKAGTYGAAPANALLSNERTTTGADTDRTVVDAARVSLPNATDIVSTPNSAACYTCHDGALSVAHMQQNGGMISAKRSDVVADRPIETCALCHGAGRDADVVVVHQ